MTLKIKYFSFLLLFALSFGGSANAQKQSADKNLPNFSQVNEQLYRGGQPTEAGVKKLKEDFSIKTIIYLRGADERAKKEEKWAKDAGINFVNVPLKNWFGPKDEKIEKILSLINDPENQPVFVHCKRGSDRTGTIIAVYRITQNDYTAKQATKEAKEFGFGWWQFWMEDFIKDYYKDFIAKK
ncbi:MAG: fused DSP-PTPase phosphatase/NAD kinase-like protein [Aridibacter sp.]